MTTRNEVYMIYYVYTCSVYNIFLVYIYAVYVYMGVWSGYD